MLSVIILFSCDENATCIDADDFGDLQREIIEVNSSDTFKCTVRPDYRAGSVYDDAKLSDTNKVNPTLKECLTTNTHINAINTNAEEMRAILGVTATNPNLKGCQDYLAEEILIDPIKKDYIDYCETFCENLCNAQSIGNSESPWIANTPRKENSDIGVNITPGSKISVIIQEGIISLPVEVSSPLISLAFDPHNFTPNDINFTTSISTGTRYDVIFGGDYFDDRSSSSPYVGCGKSPTYTRFSNVVNNNKIIYNSSCGASAINSFTEDSLIFARRNIIYFEPFPNQNDIINVPIHANPALWSCSEYFPNNKAKIKCDKGSDSYAQDGKIIGTDGMASEENIIKNGGFIRANDEVFVIKDEIIKNIPASSTTPIIFSTNDLGNSGVDVFVNLKSDCGVATAQIQVIDSAIPPNIYYQDNNLTLSNDYNPKNIPVYKGKELKVTFSSVANECSITAKSQKYLDIPIEASGEAEFQMKDLSAISYDDIPNFDATNQSLLKDYFQCLPANPFIQNFYFNISNSSKVVGMGANCNGSTPLNLNTNSGQQYLGSVPVGNSFTPVSNPEGFTKIQIFRDDSGVKDIILFIKDDDFIPTESSISLSSLSLTATFDTNNLNNANNDVFVNLKSNCGSGGSGGSVVTAKIQVIDSSAISPGILYQNNNLALSNSYNPQIIQVPKGKKLIAIFTSLTSVCQITAKSQKYPAILASDKSTIFDSTNSYNCDSDPNCQELSCNGGRISGIKAQYDASSIKALSIICSENYVPVPTATPENSCTLYGRIMNPDNNVAYDVKNKVEINSGHDEFKIISYDKVKTLAAPSGGSTPVPTFSSITGGKYVKRAYLGLQTYANSTKKSLTDPECKIPLDIANCSIGSAVSACSIYNSDVKKSWLYDCYNGDGLNGIKETSKAGTGGAGGGNNSKATRIKNGYTNDSAQAGKNGESYVNPEFGTIVVTDYADNASKGKGGVAGTTSGSEGYLDLSYDDSTWSSLQTISGNTETEITSVNGQKIYYRIKGGGGGAGGSCSGTNGGNGANGDSFSGSFTLPSGTWTLKVKIGQGGGAGANCSASPSSASNSDSPNFFKGGSGGAVDSTGGGGGAGGSASYIAVVRSDEAHDSYTASGATTYRQDFLVIAGGGGGGGGATSQNLGIKAKSPIASPTDKSTQETRKITYDLNSNAKGYRLGFSFEPLATQTTASDFYEYDNFFTKSEGAFPDSSGTRTSANSDDPLNKIVVTTAGSNKFFVRKGQVLRILPKSFEKLWNSKEGQKECGVGMILKVTPRPAILCLNGIEETLPNPMCTPNYSSSTTQVVQRTETGSTISTSSPPTPAPSINQEGCKFTTTCQENPAYLDVASNSAQANKYKDITDFNTAQPNSYYCPNPACADVTCSSKGSPTTANSGCGADASTTCIVVPETYNGSSNANPKMYSTESCGRCVARKIAESQAPPQIRVDANKNFICYSFENYNKSVNKFLSGYTSSSDKINLIGAEKTIEKVPTVNNFGSGNNFGNLANFSLMDSKTKFLFKDSVSANQLGVFKGFAVHNSDFKSAVTSSANLFGTTSIEFVNKGLYSKGQRLAVALCKENTLGECSGADISSISKFYIPLSVGGGSPTFEFDSLSGSIKRTSASANSATDFSSKCDNELIGDKFICFKGIAGESDDEIKKYRLSFKIDDTDGDAGNNSGSYKVRIEKREAPQSRAGGIVNGVLGPITMTLEGALTDDPATNYDDTIGLVKSFYIKLISNPLYRTVLSLSIVLALSFYGMGYLIGVNELKNSEILKILLKIGFIYLFTSTESGIAFFNKFFVGFFKDAINYITFSVAETFDTANSNEIRIKIRDGNFYDKGVLFKSVDKVIDLLMMGAVQKKILALLFSSVFGWIYFLIMYYCLMTYIYAIANSMLLYITCQIMVSILFVLGPIFFIFLMFKITKDMFDNWLKALIGFSLQQIFLVMTLSLFNTFVVSFLKLALGYRICWTNVLSMNLVISKVSLFNFWTVAGTNSPEGAEEDSPDSSFGSDENMPSLYLFLYLMVVISLMKKFIQMFTDLAVTLSGGLKASVLSADAMSAGKSAVGAISKQLGKAYEASVGRVVANIDNTLFDSGKIAKSRKASEREQFASNMMTRASLHKAGNDAVSKYKKEHALEFSKMSNSEQKVALENVRMEGMKNYASENDISDKKLDSLLNKTGLDYNGSNLFGLAAQVAKQGVSSGGNLFTAVRDKKIDTSFSKSEANSAIKKMKSTDQQQEFINNVKEGKVHVNKGKMEKARSFAISAVKEPVKAVLNPKATVSKIGGGMVSLGKSAVNMVIKPNEIKDEAIKRLKESGQIAKFNIPLVNKAVPEFVKNWARTDEEKKIIRDKIREVSLEKGGYNIANKVTSKAVVRDLELTAKHANSIQDKGYIDTKLAHVSRFGERVANQLTPNSKDNTQKNRTLEKNETKRKIVERLKEDNNKMSSKNQESDRSKETLKLKEEKEKAEKGLSAIDEKIKDNFKDKRFGLLKEMKEELKNFKQNERKFSNDFHKKINRLQDEDLKKGLQKNIKVIEGSGAWETFRKKIKEKFSKNRNENYVDGLIKKEIAENPELKNVIDKRNEFKVQINEADAKIKNLGDEKIDKNNGIYDKALQINEKNVKTVQDYEDKSIIGRALKAGLNKMIPLSNMASIPTEFSKTDREEYKKALKAVKEFNNGETTKDFEKFVNNHKDKLPKDD